MKVFAAALLAQIIGAAAVLLIATREWQTITTVRSHPFTDDVVGVSGRTVDGAVTALALVALAGVVAIIATKGVARRVIGALVALSGIALIWRIVGAMPAVDTRVLATSSAPPTRRSPDSRTWRRTSCGVCCRSSVRCSSSLPGCSPRRAAGSGPACPRATTGARSTPNRPVRVRMRRCGPRWNAATIRPSTTHGTRTE